MNVTEWVIVGAFVLLLAYDGVVAYLHAPTESQVLRDWAWKWSTVPLIAGILCGHWFGNQVKVSGSAWINAVPILLGYILWDMLLQKFAKESLEKWYRYPLIHVVVGILVGMFLWGQEYGASIL
jgi:hypothetical protein